jgi:RHS repeat-associated protein
MVTVVNKTLCPPARSVPSDADVVVLQTRAVSGVFGAEQLQHTNSRTLRVPCAFPTSVVCAATGDLANVIWWKSVKDPTVYLYDGNNTLEEVDNSGNVLARYTQSTRTDEEMSELRSGTASYYQADGPGSITSLSNSAGTLANTYTYGSFGNLTASTGTLVNPFRFTGREFDSETSIYYYRARYVDTGTGRFISEDPLGFKGGINFFAYVLNNPINLTDPLGLKACEDCTKAAPLPANSPKCDSYGSQTYAGTGLKCFCKCAGDGAWSQQVRGCLACEHDRGTNPFIAHQRCYRASGTWSAPVGVINKCYQECLAQPSGPGFSNMPPF